MRWDPIRCAERLGLAMAFLLCAFVPAYATTGSTEDALLRAVTAELQTLASHAGTIFVGQVARIDRREGVVEVTFQVEQPVRGAVAATFVLREWAGLWPPGQARYALGQRVLAFVHSGSPAGLSTPVHGSEGLVPVQVYGADQPERLDVRRVAASIVRAPGTPLPLPAASTVPLEAVLATLVPAVRYTSPRPPHLPAGGSIQRGLPRQPVSPDPEPVALPRSVASGRFEEGETADAAR